MSKPKNALRAVTERVLDLFTSEGALFTSLDVSNEVKRALPDAHHRDVAPLVRDLYAKRAMGDYTQTMIDVLADGDDPARAFLYHLPEDPASLYSHEQRAQRATPPVSAAAHDEYVLPRGATAAPVIVGRDGRARVPKALLRNAGVDPDSVLASSFTSPPRVVLESSQSAARGTSLSVLHCEDLDGQHPSMVHLPRHMMTVFAGTRALRADVHGRTVIVHPV